MSLNTASSCVAYPFVVSTRFGIRSLRRCNWFSTCAHCALIASSWLTNVLYEQPVTGSAASARTISRAAVLRVICIVMCLSHESTSLRRHHLSLRVGPHPHALSLARSRSRGPQALAAPAACHQLAPPPPPPELPPLKPPQ